MTEKRGKALRCALILICLASLVTACGRKGLAFGDYASEQEWREALLRQIPPGSSLGDVVRFLEHEGFQQEPDPRSGIGCEYYDSAPNWLMLKICDDWWSFGGYWLIEFLFDENGKLNDIDVELGPT